MPRIETREAAGPDPIPSVRLPRQLRIGFWSLAILLGFLQTWANRHDVGGDGVNYLDMGEAFLRGDWKTAINGLWSPGYSWILGLVLQVVRPSRYWEYTVVHLVGFGVFLIAMRCFEFFLTAAIEDQRSRSSVTTDGSVERPPLWTWMVFGYTLFLWACLDLIGLVWVNPDMCVAALVFLAAGLVLRLRIRRPTWWRFALLGVVLGVGYLMKTVLFVLAFAFIAAAVIACGSLRRAFPGVVIALVLFAMLATPFVAALSSAKGRFTIGDSGRLNYAWFVLGIPRRHWQGQPSGSGVPAHPTQRRLARPEVYSFEGGVGGTYPLWYDPSYWYEGLEVRVNPRKQLAALYTNSTTIVGILCGLNGALIFGTLLLVAIGWEFARFRSAVIGQLPLLLPVVSAFTLYALVHVEARYLAPFVVLLFTSVFSIVSLHRSRQERRAIAAVSVLMLISFLSPVGPTATRRYYSAIGELIRPGRSSPHVMWQVSTGLAALGIREGEKVAVTSHPGHSTWARLARARVIAEVYYRPIWPETLRNNYWEATKEEQTRVHEAMADSGSRFLVADEVPKSASLEGWMPVAGTSYYVRPLIGVSPAR